MNPNLSGAQFKAARDAWHGDLSMEITHALVGAHPDRYPGWSGDQRPQPEWVEHGHALQQAAEPVPHRLYHGVGADVSSNYAPGQVHSVPLMATSKDRSIAEGFAVPDEPQPHTIYEFEPGARATRIHDREHVVTGEYEVTHVQPADARGQARVVLRSRGAKR